MFEISVVWWPSPGSLRTPGLEAFSCHIHRPILNFEFVEKMLLFGDVKQVCVLSKYMFLLIFHWFFNMFLHTKILKWNSGVQTCVNLNSCFAIKPNGFLTVLTFSQHKINGHLSFSLAVGRVWRIFNFQKNDSHGDFVFLFHDSLYDFM